MPVTSSTSSIKRWPTSKVVLGAANAWARSAADQHPNLIALGYFGSYARGEAGFGSDLDLIAVVNADDRPTIARNLDWHTETLPVPADLLVYTLREWKLLEEEGGRFWRTLASEVQWLVSPRAFACAETKLKATNATAAVGVESSAQGDR